MLFTWAVTAHRALPKSVIRNRLNHRLCMKHGEARRRCVMRDLGDLSCLVSNMSGRERKVKNGYGFEKTV